MPNYLKKISAKLINKIIRPNNNNQPLIYILANSTIGEFCSVGKDCYVFNTHIGDFTYLSQRVTIMNCTIGKFCSIAQGVNACLGTHPSSKFVSTHPAFFSLSKQNGMTFSDKNYFEEMGKTKIGNDVWIGVNAIIMDNITIGNGAIIGAGAVVTKDIPPYAIAAGTPAKIVRYRFTEDEIAFLETFKWWDKDYDWLKNNFKDLHDVKLFIKKHGVYHS
jgi:acetyltransferase-like isoleucine patch superfamily enzyme